MPLFNIEMNFYENPKETEEDCSAHLIDVRCRLFLGTGHPFFTIL